MNDDYKGLKPGLYLQVGDSIKTLADGREYYGSWSNALRGGSNANPSVEQIAGEVSWVWIALEKRRQKLLEIPYSWQRNESDIEETPFNMKHRELVQQVDTALQLYSCAYLLKQRGSFSSEAVGVRWLDPMTMEPDLDTADPRKGGIQQFFRYPDGSAGRKEVIPAADIIYFMNPGMRELVPSVSAVRATSLAGQILRSLGQSIDVFYDNNALPVMLIKVPISTGVEELGRLENAFRRLFNARRGTENVRTKGVRSDVEVIPLSFKPTDLAMTELEDSKRDAILAAHDVPKSEVLADAANYATDVSAARRMITAIGSRFEYIAETFNTDADFEAAGYILDVRVSDHTAMKEDEAQRANAFSTYVTGGFTTEAAAWLVGIVEDDFPAGMEIFDEPEPIPEPLQQSQQLPAPMQDDTEAREKEEQQLKNWIKRRKDPNIDDFEAYYLTPEEKSFILYDVIGASMPDPFEQWANVMKQYQPVENGNDPA